MQIVMRKILFIIVILLVLTTSTSMLVMVVNNNATAAVNCETEETVTSCQGGEKYEDRPGGHGGNFEVDTSPGGEFSSSGGFGSGNTNDQGGFHCEGFYNTPEGTNCVGSEDFD